MVGVNDWHRQKRKKELQKNKEARIAQRDEKVRKEKSVRQVQDEIRQLERQYRDAEKRPHAIQSKLDRLQKELKLVKEEEEARKAENAKKTQQQSKSYTSDAQQFRPLDNPAISIYYDPILNPYGVPPPGKPKMYHKLGGGTTMDIRLAIDPTSPHEPFKKETAPVSKEKTRPPLDTNTKKNDYKATSFPPRGQAVEDNRRQPTTKSKNPEKTVKQQTPKENNKQADQPTGETPKAPSKVAVDPSQLPSLPKPSAAVERLKRKRKTGNSIQADIWASQEEMQYEAQVGYGNLEGATEKIEHEWWYKDDTSGSIQGPYSKAQMVTWVRAGYFPPTTPMRCAVDDPWKPLQHYEHLREALPDSMRPVMQKKERNSVQDRIAALKRGTSEKEQDSDQDSVQKRIAVLRGEVNSNASSDEDSVQKRIAALRGERSGEPKQDNITTSTEEGPPPPPRLPPVPSSTNDFIMAPYPVLDDVPAYPILDSEIGVYPIDDSNVYDNDAVSDYPAIGPYGEEVETTKDAFSDDPPAKKKVKVDKALISLVPKSLKRK